MNGCFLSTLDLLQDLLVEEFTEILSCNTNVNVIVDLNRNTYSVTLSDAKATGKNYIILKMILFYSFFKKLYDIGRAL